MTTPNQNDINERQDVINIRQSDGLSGVAAAVADLAGGVRDLDKDVKHDGDLRQAKLKWIQRVLFVMVPAVLLLIIMTASNVFLIHQNNKSSIQRSKIATEQRQQQQQLLIDLNNKTVATARCAIQAKGNVSIYDACIAQVK